MFSNPEQNVNKLGLREGMKVADFGAGTGLYAKAASKKVGNDGIVYAVDIQKDLIKKLEKEISEWGLSNIKCLWGDIEQVGGTKIGNKLMDVVIISNVLFQVPDKIGLIDEAKRILKDNGKILFIDWMGSFAGMGPSVDHVIKEDKAIELFKSRGFKLLEKITVSDHHYGIIFVNE